MASPRRRALPVLAAVCMILGASRIPLEIRATLKARPPHAEQRAFLAERLAAVPPDAWIHLVTGPNPEFASLDLYPRKIRVVTADRLQELRRSEPDAWVARVPVPFDRAGAFLGRARDLP